VRQFTDRTDRAVWTALADLSQPSQRRMVVGNSFWPDGGNEWPNSGGDFQPFEVSSGSEALGHGRAKQSPRCQVVTDM